MTSRDEALRALEKKYDDKADAYAHASKSCKTKSDKAHHEVKAAAYREMADDVRAILSARHEVAPVAVPEGWALVPQQMTLTPESLGFIETMCAGPDNEGIGGEGGEDRWLDGILWVGETIGDNGEKYWGLNIACADLLDEGSIPVCEFDRPTSPAHTSEARDAARYRWMRRGLANTKLLPDGVADLFANALDQNDATKFDAAIDAAMRQEAGSRE